MQRCSIGHYFQHGSLQKGVTMKTVNVSQEQLLADLVKNRKKHAKEYELAAKEYKEAARVAVEKLLEKIVSGKPFKLYISIPEPVSHVSDYDCTIQMVEMSVDRIIELTELEFRQYVLDEWQWRDELKNSRMLYNSLNSTL
jgi:hypothetical protein